MPENGRQRRKDRPNGESHLMSSGECCLIIVGVVRSGLVYRPFINFISPTSVVSDLRVCKMVIYTNLFTNTGTSVHIYGHVHKSMHPRPPHTLPNRSRIQPERPPFELSSASRHSWILFGPCGTRSVQFGLGSAFPPLHGRLHAHGALCCSSPDAALGLIHVGSEPRVCFMWPLVGSMLDTSRFGPAPESF